MTPIQTTNRDFAHAEPSVSYPTRRWEMFSGVGKLYICSPGFGPDSMFPVTQFSSKRGQVGTDEEIRTIQKAVWILNREQRDNADATRGIVDEAVKRAAGMTGELADEPEDPIDPDPAPVKLPPRYLVGDWRKRGWRQKGEMGFIHVPTSKLAKDAHERNAIDAKKGLLKEFKYERNISRGRKSKATAGIVGLVEQCAGTGVGS